MKEVDDTSVAAQERRVSFSFVGDFLIHGPVFRAAKIGSNTYDFTPLVAQMQGLIDSDIAVCNIDGLVDAYGENKNITSYPNFNTPYEILNAIKSLGFNYITTANNHAYDKGWTGVVKNLENIKSAGLTPLGTYISQEEYDKLYITEANGLKIGMSAWSALDNGLAGTIGEKDKYAMHKFNQDSFDEPTAMLNEVKRMREAGAEVVIMFLHWGAEYSNSPTDSQRFIAKQLAAAGVDVIVGGHTHCVQPIEWLDDTLCIYSLGNFFADQIDLSNPIPKTQYGMLVNLDIVKSNGRVEIENAEYMPTFTYRDSIFKTENSSTSYGYILAPAGKYAKSGTLPNGINSKIWEVSKKAYNHVTSIVGESISVREIYK
ncbi:MAG: CapA family protein [Clostridiales bacterium]|nr:CapA family protein [Clostridiales bacterium]